MNIRTSFWPVGVVALVGTLRLMAVQPVYAHQGMDSGQNVLLAWNWDPTVPLLTILAAHLYLAGLRNWENPSRPVSTWQRVSFFAGLAAIFLALQSPIDPLAEHLFFVHQVQHLLIRMIGPILVLLGAPLTPTLRGLPPWAIKRIVRPTVRNAFVRSAYEFLNLPLVALLLFLGTLYFWQVPDVHNLSLRNDLVHYIMHTTMLFTGFLFWWVMIESGQHRSRLNYGLRIFVLVLSIAPNTFLGAIIVLADIVLYNAYGDVARLLPISLLTDQIFGGQIIWVPADMMSLFAIMVVVRMWFRQEDEKQRLEDIRMRLLFPREEKKQSPED